MEHITEIQELVDEHKQEMPTGVATALMQKCQEAYDAQPKLYKLTWTMVDSHAHVVQVEDDDEPDFARVELSHKTQTLIVEAVDDVEVLNHLENEYGGKLNTIGLPHHGIMWKGWLSLSKPAVLMDNNAFGRKDHMVIIHSIEPYTPKRARE